MTRAEKNRIISRLVNKYDWRVVNGYCKYCEEYIGRWELVKIGENRTKKYGWNWSLYLHPPTRTIYCDGYRNF